MKSNLSQKSLIYKVKGGVKSVLYKLRVRSLYKVNLVNQIRMSRRVIKISFLKSLVQALKQT